MYSSYMVKFTKSNTIKEKKKGKNNTWYVYTSLIAICVPGWGKKRGGVGGGAWRGKTEEGRE